MNGLLEKFNEYKDISNYRIKYTLYNGEVIDFKLKQTDFPHLIGLHKLVDIPLIGQFNDVSNSTVSAKFLISKIKKESQLTESIIKNSVYFPDIAQRYQNFSKENLLGLTYTADRSNIKSAGEWTDFQALLEDGSYIADAYAEYPKLNQNVTVYKLSDIAYDGSDETATNPTIGMEFKVISSDTRILSYGSTGGRRDVETGEFQQCYHIPVENERGYGMDRYLIVLGEDITDPEIQGYRDGGCEEGEEIKGVTADVERYETTLGEIVWELLIEECEPSYFDEEQVDIASDEMLFGSIAELMYDYGILSGNVAERYEWGSLEDMWSETYNMQRVMYMSFEVVIPANGSVRVDTAMRKDASFDFVGEGTDRNGYDMVTQLGSALKFSEQTASVSNTQFIEIVYQNFGFDLDNGIVQVELDLNEPHYYMEIRKISSDGEEKISIN